LAGKLEEKRLLGRPGIRITLKWILKKQNCVALAVFIWQRVGQVMGFFFLRFCNYGKFHDYLRTYWPLKKVLFHGVSCLGNFKEYR
jgi:hypothetical protein